MKLIRIGYWRSADDPSWPDAGDFVDSQWDLEEKECVSRYIRHGTLVRPYMGHSLCRICGRLNGTLEFSDGVYIWPEGLAHYLDDHQVRVPPDFVDHVRRRMDEFDAATVESTWWLQQSRPHLIRLDLPPAGMSRR